MAAHSAKDPTTSTPRRPSTLHGCARSNPADLGRSLHSNATSIEAPRPTEFQRPDGWPEFRHHSEPYSKRAFHRTPRVRAPPLRARAGHCVQKPCMRVADLASCEHQISRLHSSHHSEGRHKLAEGHHTESRH